MRKAIGWLVGVGALAVLGTWWLTPDPTGMAASSAASAAQPGHEAAVAGSHQVTPNQAVMPPLSQTAGTSGTVAPPSPDSAPVIERGVRYVPLEQQQLPSQWKDHLREQLKNLRETGSLSRGKVTHEFTLLGPMADTLRRNGIDKLQSQLAIQASDVGKALGPSFSLVGADVQGKQIEGMGYAGFFQIQSNPHTGQMAELSENQLDLLAGEGTVVAPEYANDQVASNYPATLEQLTGNDGAALNNLQWIVKDRTFHLTTRNLSVDETRQLATTITQRFVAMPFGGWRKRYEFDPENPVHRLALTDKPAPAPTR